MWGSSDDVTVMLNHFKGEKIFENLFIYNKEKHFAALLMSQRLS